jgi:hypothetical protein
MAINWFTEGGLPTSIGVMGFSPPHSSTPI